MYGGTSVKFEKLSHLELYEAVLPHGMYIGIELLTLVKVLNIICGAVVANDLMLWILSQNAKASLSMVVTELGMVTFLRLKLFLNAITPILVTVFGITVLLQPEINLLLDVLIIALQLFRLS